MKKSSSERLFFIIDHLGSSPEQNRRKAWLPERNFPETSSTG
jgi:hypothetical protein